MSTALTVPRQQDALTPALSVQQAAERYNQMVDFTKTVMVKDQDYGVIPGVSKPCLYKAGAEKLCTLFGMTPTFQLIERTEDWTGKDHGEPFFYYFYKCILVRGDRSVGEGDGSCNSFEKKYRYREGKRKCPSCGAEGALIMGKPEFEKDPRYKGGYFCYPKKGGCGQKFVKGDPAIDGQPVASVPNPDIAEQVNTIQKMAQKRALLAATLIACNASAFYTQDLDDMRTIEVEYEDVTPIQEPPRGSQSAADAVAARKLEELGASPEVVQKAQEPRPAKASTSKPNKGQINMLQAFRGLKKELEPLDPNMVHYYEVLRTNGVEHSNELTDQSHAREVYKQIGARKAALLEREAIRQDIGEDAFWARLEPLGIDNDVTLDMQDGQGLKAVIDVLRATPASVTVSPSVVQELAASLNEPLPDPQWKIELLRLEVKMIEKRAKGKWLDIVEKHAGARDIKAVGSQETADRIVFDCEDYLAGRIG
jgi:hypothetical protein